MAATVGSLMILRLLRSVMVPASLVAWHWIISVGWNSNYCTSYFSPLNRLQQTLSSCLEETSSGENILFPLCSTFPAGFPFSRVTWKGQCFMLTKPGHHETRNLVALKTVFLVSFTTPWLLVTSPVRCSLCESYVTGTSTAGNWRGSLRFHARRHLHMNKWYPGQYQSTDILIKERKGEMKQRIVFLKKSVSPWLVWLSGLSVGLWTERSMVWFPVNTHTWVVGQVPIGGRVWGNHTFMFLSLSFSFPSSLSKHK